MGARNFVWRNLPTLESISAVDYGENRTENGRAMGKMAYHALLGVVQRVAARQRQLRHDGERLVGQTARLAVLAEADRAAADALKNRK